MSGPYRTLAAPLRFEADPTKGSRFLATLEPVASCDDARHFLERVRAEFDDATHTAWAWRLGRDGAEFRFHDDGEPGGSAGRPILQVLEGRDVTFVCAAVTRWFGGTKLGVGGLVRAYAGAAAQALDRAAIVAVHPTVPVTLALPYPAESGVRALLETHGLRASGTSYGEDVRMVVDVPEVLLETLRRELADRTAGRASLSALAEPDA